MKINENRSDLFFAVVWLDCQLISNSIVDEPYESYTSEDLAKNTTQIYQTQTLNDLEYGKSLPLLPYNVAPKAEYNKSQVQKKSHNSSCDVLT